MNVDPRLRTGCGCRDWQGHSDKTASNSGATSRAGGCLSQLLYFAVVEYIPITETEVA